ncbi:hypothetical protein [Desulfotruncus alcoholivorax]|uniref:hypothetical protein n=1 Tax=Desulfotruncus alcoholivorax TaxID=265477 RepID=UPI000487E3A6|nr:hypothetical protein [Desulfotruncus alcoholivorax]
MTGNRGLREEMPVAERLSGRAGHCRPEAAGTNGPLTVRPVPGKPVKAVKRRAKFISCRN